MFLSEFTCTVRRPVYSYLTLQHRSQLCRVYFQQISVHPAKLYSSYTKQFKIYKDSKKFLQFQLDENVKDKAGDFKTVDVKDDNGTLVSPNLKFSKTHLEKLYKEPVGNLCTIYKTVNNEFNDKECIHFNYEVDNTSTLSSSVINYKCTINISWPVAKTFVHIAPNKKVAARDAALKCLHWLHANNKVRHLKPVMYTKKQINDLTTEPIHIKLQPQFTDEIKALITTFNHEIKPIIQRSSTIAGIEDVSQQQESNFSDEVVESEIAKRNSRLTSRFELQNTKHSNLPIFDHKKEILDCLETNRVLLIKGDTGCGKSTQVPQFIMDTFTKKNKATECNILVSQPRRISAISVANRVARERYEVIGDVVGYHVRFQNVLPKSPGSILFCTTGILLQRIQSNPTLKGVSHVIIDEVHERSLEIDMLLALLKRTLNVNPSLKVIIMSATMNVELFQQYFSCAFINVPGKVYPVKMHFLDDIDLFKNELQNNDSSVDTTIPYEKIVILISWIIKNKPRGAMLCFLPGWQEIKYLECMLERSRIPNLHIMPLHSKLNVDDQQKIFNPVPENAQKIILATDIAESSITIGDISYVIDTVLKKEMQWNKEKSMYSLNTTWVAQANVCQRKGRAGRIRPGESYHFITKEAYNRLNVYPVPEIHRTSLEKAIILSQIYNNEQIDDFFNNMPEQPNKTALTGAILNLQNLRILDENEKLTPLGKRITNITLEPRLSRALIFSSIFQCLYPILNIIVMFTVNNEMATNSLTNKSNMRKQKQQFHETSDHIAVLDYFAHSKEYNDDLLFTDKHKRNTFQLMKRMRELHIAELVESGILGSELDCESVNAYTGNRELIRAVLYSATNQLLTQSSYGYKNGYFTRNANILMSNNNEKVILKTDSVNYNRKMWPSPFLTYIVQVEHSDRRTALVSDSSIISPLSVLLFTQGDIQCQEMKDAFFPESTTDVIITFENFNNIRLCCDKKTATLLQDLRSVLWNVVDYIIRYESIDSAEENLKSVKFYKETLLCLISKMLYEASGNIDTSNQLANRNT